MGEKAEGCGTRISDDARSGRRFFILHVWGKYVLGSFNADRVAFYPEEKRFLYDDKNIKIIMRVLRKQIVIYARCEV